MTDKLNVLIQAVKSSLTYRKLTQICTEEIKSAISESDFKKKHAQKNAIDEILIHRESILALRNLELYLQLLADLIDYVVENYDSNYLKQSLVLDEETRKLLLRLKDKVFSIIISSEEKNNMLVALDEFILKFKYLIFDDKGKQKIIVSYFNVVRECTYFEQFVINHNINSSEIQQFREIIDDFKETVIESEKYFDLSEGACSFISNTIMHNYNQFNKDQILSLVDGMIKIKHLNKTLKLAKEIESILPTYFNPEPNTYNTIKNTFDNILLKMQNYF